MSTTGREQKSRAIDDFIVGSHSMMLALEPRFMFDAAVAATDADVVDQAADAFADACESGSYQADSEGDDFSHSPVSAGDDGAYDVGAPGVMAAAAVGNSKADLNVGDGSDQFIFTVNEDSVLRFTGENAIVISDAENDVLIITIEVENGVLNASRVPGVIYDGLGTGTVTLTGSADSLTEALLQLTYKGNQFYNSEDARYGPENLSITIKDYEPSLQTSDRIIEKTYEIYVTPVNNAPQVDQPSEVNIEIEQNEIGSIPPITIFDPDYGDEITVTLQTGNGRLIFGDGVDYDFQAKGNGNDYNTYTIRGSVDEINAILADLGYQGERNFSGTDQILVTVTDGKSDPVVTEPIDVLVTPVNQPPEISGEPDIPSAEEGGSVILNEGNFNIEDPDSSDAQIVFKILEDPEYGSLYYQAIAGDDSSWVKMGVGSTFTLEEVKDGRIRYTHDGSQVRPDLDPSSAVDGFRFSVSDSAGGAIDDASLSIDLEPVNQAPEVSVEEDPDVRTDPTDGIHLVVWEGEHDAVIKFVVDDPDQNPEVDHIVTFTGLPQDGTLYIVNDQGVKVEVIEGMEIPMSWITAGRLTYSHNGDDGAAVGKPMGETRDDSFSVTVTDDGGGGGQAAVKSWDGELRIQVWPNNDDPEWTFPPKDVGVDTRDPQVIDNNNLSLTDPDSPDDDLTYTITQLPEHGSLYIRMWDSETGDYYYVEVVAATYDPATGTWHGGTSITQSMIDNASNPNTYDPVLVYHYPGEGPVEDLLDSIHFVVRDGAITSWDNDVPLEDKSHEGGIGEFNPETGRWELTEQTLNIVVNIDPDDMGPGELDIRTPEDASIVIDGNLDVQVNEGGLVQINTDALNAYYNDGNGDLDASNLRYRLVDLPDHGQLLRLESDGTYTVLTPGSLFYQSDIEAGLIFYQHNGNESFTDSFKFSVSDGARDSEVESFTFNVRPVNDTPTVNPGGPIQVDENNAVDVDGNPDPYGDVDNGVVLGPDDIRLYDVDGSGDRSDLSGYDEYNDLSFVVTNLPDNGRLYIYSGSGDRGDMANWILVQVVDFFDTQTADWSGITGSVITMQDLINGNLMYFNDGEENIADGFTIVVNDNMGVWNAPENGGNSVTGEFTIHIAITPINDPPRNDANETLVVDEDGEKVIDSSHLHFSDPDNTPNQVTYTVTERPENGVLYLFHNGRWVALGEGSTFTQKDIDDGNLKYVHDGSEWHSDSFTYTVSDGDAILPGNVFDIDINPINKAPEVEVNGDDVRYLGVEDDMDLGGWFSISDPDYDGDEKELNDLMEMTITATVTEDKYFDHESGVAAGSPFGIIGVQDLNDIVGLQLIEQADGKLVLRGTREALQEALDRLTYRSAHMNNPSTPIDINSAVTFTVELNDLNNGGGAGASHEASDGLVGSASGTIYVSPIDTPPSFNKDGPVQEDPVTLDVNEDKRLEVEYNGNPIQITDKDAFDRNNNTVTLAVDNGILWLSEIPGLTIQGNLSGEVVLTGTLEAINEALATLKYVPAANWNGLDQLTVSYGDAGNTGSGGPLEVEGIVNIHVHAVNDQPELNVTDEVVSLDGSNTTDFQNVNTPGAEYSIDDLIDLDPDLNNDPNLGDTDYFELTISLTQKDDLTDYFGELRVDKIGNLEIETREGGSVIVLKGTKDEINEALKTLSILMTESVEENSQFNLRFELDDGRNGGLGPPEGAEGIIVKDVLILANNENDQPEIRNTEDIIMDEDSKYSWDGNAIVIDDPDALDFSLQITLTVQHGYLNWNAQNLAALGITVESINAYNDMAGRHYTIIGSLDAINAALAALVYTPETDWNGTDTLHIYVNDRGNTTPGKPAEDINPLPKEYGGDGLVTTATVTITINPKNDSPVANEDNVTLPSIHEDIDSASNTGSTVEELFGGLFNDNRDQKFNDPNNPGGSESNAFIGIWVVGGTDAGDKGTWQYSQNGVDWLDVEDGMFLDKDTVLRFQPTQDYNVRRGELPDLEVRLVESNEYAANATTDLTTGSSYESHELQRDGVPRYTGIVTLSHEVIPVNDAPVLSGPETTPEKPIELDEDTQLNFTGPNAITIADVDADPSESPDYQMTITLSVENGTLTLGDTTGLTGYDGPADTLTLTGTLKDINDALSTLSYQGDANYYGPDQLTVTINDRGDGSDEQGTGELSDSTIIYLNLAAVNDPPVITTSPEASVLEDGALAFTEDNTIVISDVDLEKGDGEHLMTVTLSGIQNGSLTIDSQYEGLIAEGENGTGSLTLTGTLDEINAALASLVYTPSADWNGSETLTVTANDNGNYGSGGPQETTFDVDITVVPINDAPVATDDAVTMDPIDEDTYNSPGQTVEDLFGGLFTDGRDDVAGGSDADDFAGIVVVGNNATEDQGTWQYYDAGTGQWVDIAADVGDVNATYLDRDTLIRFVPKADYYGTPGQLQVRLVDNAAVDPNNPSLTQLPENGTSGLDVSENGGTTRYSSEIVELTIVINPVNDAPVITTSPDASVLEDGSLAFTGDNGIVISDVDVDGGDGEMTVTLSGITNGTLSIDGEYEGLITAGGNGTGSLTLTGTLDEINAALASLVYTPSADWNGSETLTVTANDNGNYGSGGPQETTFDVDITVVPINDAPVATDDAVIMEPIDEDTDDPSGQTVGDLFGGIFSDTTDEVPEGSDANDFAGIVITGNSTQAGQGAWQYYDAVTDTWVDIPLTLNDGNGLFLSSDTVLRFLPQPDFNGTPGGLQARLVDSAALDPNNPNLTALPQSGSIVDVRNNGNTTRYSAEVVALTIHINAVNDAPTRNGEEKIDTGLTAYYHEDGNYPVWTVEEMLAGKFNDSRDYQRDKADDGSLENDFAGIAVTDIPDTQYGHYEYFDGRDWIRIDESLVDQNTALILSKDTQMRFVPVADITGAPDLYATVRLIDSSGGALTTGEQIDKSVLNDEYDQTGVYSDSENAVVLVIRAIGKNTPPYVDNLPDDLQVTERGDPVRIAEGSEVGDRELLNIPNIGWEEFTITIRREGGANAEDLFSYWNGSEFIEITAGDSLYYQGTLVGEVVRNVDGEIVLKFNANADQESVSDILGNVGYSIDTHRPPESVTLQYVLNDGNFDDRQGEGGELEGIANQVITIIPVPEDPIAEDNINYIELDDKRGGEAGGNILDNAYDPDGTPVHVIDPGNFEGQYGYLTVDSEGNYVYVVNPDHPDVMNLEPGQQLIDVFEYQVGDGNDGEPATATLTIIIETTINRVISPPVTVTPNPDPGQNYDYDRDHHTFQSLWSLDRRNGLEDHLRLADLVVDKPVVPAVNRANAVSDWEIISALTVLHQYGIDTDVLMAEWNEGILKGVHLSNVSLQALPADSFLIYRINSSALSEGLSSAIQSLRAMMADGSPLPYWVYFDAANGSITVTPPDGVSGDVYVMIIAVDAEGNQSAEAVIFSVAPPTGEKPETSPFEWIDSATERDALEHETIRHEAYWEPGMLHTKDYENSILMGAPALAGQLSLLGSYGMARRAKRLESAALDTVKKR